MSDTPSQPAASKYRKKPVVIEAIQWTGLERDLEHVLPFFVDFSALPNNGATIQPGIGYTPPSGELTIPTLEGDMTASPGDFIIRGVKGEYYPCKPEIFAMTYEPAVVAPTQPASDYCKCEHTLFIHPDGGKCNGITPITQFTCDCKQFVSEPADATAEKPSPDYTALIARGCEFLAKIDFLYEPGDNRKSWSDYRIIDDLTRALEAVSAKPSQAEARLASLRQRATDLANDLEAAGYHGFAFGAQKIANIAARGSNEAAPSNTLRERIAYALGDVSARCHVELGRNPLMLELADAVLALLDEEAVTE